MKSLHLAFCVVIISVFIESSSGLWWEMPKNDDDNFFNNFLSAAVGGLAVAAFGFFSMFAQLGKRSTVANGNLEKTLFYFNLAVEVDKEKCLQAILCEAAFLGKKYQENATNFQSTASHIATTIAKRKPKDISKIKKMKGGHMVESMLIGNKVESIGKCKPLSKTCPEKHKNVLGKYLEKIFDEAIAPKNGTVVDKKSTTEQESTTESIIL